MERGQYVADRCLQLYVCGCADDTARAAADAVRQLPDDGHAWQLAGLARLRTGDTAGALAALETATALVPLNPSARCALADCYVRAGKTGLAVDLYDDLAADATCPSALLPGVASGLGAVGADRAALGVCRELARREPGSHEALFGMAYYQRRLGRSVEEVTPLVARAHELAPESAVYRVVLASLLDNLGRRDEAYELLRDVQPASATCPRCLRRILTMFWLAGNAQGSQALRGRDDAGDSTPKPCP
jgi:Flp pilus assembly protein TadD